MTWGFGKVILLGEHAVVHGEPALAGALARGVRARAIATDGPSSLRIDDWQIAVTSADDHPVAEALRALLAAAGVRDSLALTATADLPVAAGLGSSAAMAVAAARAICEATGQDADDDRIAAIADAAERCFHGTPSGIDVALATRGGLGLFRRGRGLTPVDATPIELAVGLSGVPRRTADVVARVGRALTDDAGATGRIQRLGAAAAAGVDALVAGDLPALGRLFDAAHDDLAGLGVSSPVLDTLARAARDAGAHGAKLTGAGGGGAVIAVGAPHAVCAAWRALGYDAFSCRVGVREPAPAPDAP